MVTEQMNTAIKEEKLNMPLDFFDLMKMNVRSAINAMIAKTKRNISKYVK